MTCEQCVNLEHRLDMLKTDVMSLQERVAHAELARDNATAQRDEAQKRAKEKGITSGRIIAELLGLVKSIGASHPDLREQIQAALGTTPELVELEPLPLPILEPENEGH